MELPVQVKFRNMHSSKALERIVIEKAEKLKTFYNRISGCRVTVEASHRHHHKGIIYHVRIELAVPRGSIVVSREPENDASHEDVAVAIRDSFDAVKRKLRAYADSLRGFERARAAS